MNPPAAVRSSPHRPRHRAIFYERDEFLVDSVAALAGASLRRGEGAVLIATPLHLDAVAVRLREDGHDLGVAAREDRYLALDAAACLDDLLVGGEPDGARFERLVGDLVRRAAGGVESRPVWGFAEMVDLLLAGGNAAAALAIERFCDLLAARVPFERVCGYALRDFAQPANEDAFREVCALHDRVTPAESYSRVRGPQRFVAVSQLQQKAVRLEREIAGRKDVEELLRRRENELEDFFENGLEPLQMVGPDGRVLRANRALLDLLGYSREEYVGHHISEFHADPEKLATIWERIDRGGEILDETEPFRCRDGSIRTVRLYCNGRFEGGELVNTRCFLRDVTEQVRLENELRERCEQLAEADRRKDEFLAMLGHELRNPLFVVRNALELMQPASEDDAATREIALRQSEQLGRLLDELLDVGRILRGQVRLENQRLELSDLVQDSLAIASAQFEKRKHRLTVHASESSLRVEGDAARLEQVFVNLLENAARYTRPGGSIEVSMGREGREAVVRVRDSGVGMEPELLARVFEPFSQGRQGPDRADGGLGVGLTVVKQLVELHGGRAEAASDGPGRGSVLEIRLPLADTSSPDGDRDESPGRCEATRLIVVEDNPDLAMTLRILLQRAGYDVRVFHDGLEALRAARADVPDVMLIDIGLPGIDGYEVANRLRLDPAFATVPLIALTGYGADHDAARALAAGFDRHLVKPLNVSRLHEVIEGLLRACVRDANGLRTPE